VSPTSEIVADPAAASTRLFQRPAKRNLSALDAAARVLATAGEPMGCKELIEVMAVKGLWKSPGGQTPWGTLHSAIARKITEKGKQSRFRKAQRGKFALKLLNFERSRAGEVRRPEARMWLVGRILTGRMASFAHFQGNAAR